MRVLAGWIIMPMPDPPLSIDTSRPNAARVYDYALGGSHNFAVDREFADRLWAEIGGRPPAYRLNRSFLRRAVRFMLAHDIDQFLDLGSGIPTVGNVHEIAQRTNPDARIVYVDNEPVAVAHARQLLADVETAAMVQADLRDTDTVLGNEDTRRLLDFDRPIGLLLVGVLYFIPDDPTDIVRRYRTALTGGGYLAVSHLTEDGRAGEGGVRKGVTSYRQTSTPLIPRSAAELRGILHGLELVDPGITWIHQWHPDQDGLDLALPDDSAMYAAMAVLPPIR